MNRATSDYTNSSVDEEANLKRELAQRRREYRIMEKNAKQKCLEMENLIQKQSAAITQLEKEETELATDMKLAASLKNTKQDGDNAGDIKELVLGKQQYTDLIDMEKEAIKEVDKEIAEIEHKIHAQRRSMGGTFNSHNRHFTTQNTIMVLENRLDKATREFNGLTADNRKLREDIQHFRNQRGVFETQYKRQRKDLAHKKQDQNLLIEKSALAYDQRDEARLKMAALRERNTKNVTQYNMEYKDLLRQLDHDKILKKFVLDKAEERWEQAEEQVQQRLQKIEDRAEKSAENTLNEYKNAFDDVQKITGLTDSDEIIQQFVTMEDKNFALFNYINEVNNQLQKHDDQKRLLDRDIDQCLAASDEMLDKKDDQIKIARSSLDSATAQLKSSENMLKETNDVLNQLKAGIQSIYTSIGCNAMKSQLGEQLAVSNDNVLEYLGEIQDKTNDQLQQFMTANVLSENDPETFVNCSQPTVSKQGPGIAAPSDQAEADGAAKEPAKEENIHDVRTLRRIAIQTAKAREVERKNQAEKSDDKHLKHRKK